MHLKILKAKKFTRRDYQIILTIEKIIYESTLVRSKSSV